MGILLDQAVRDDLFCCQNNAFVSREVVPLFAQGARRGTGVVKAVVNLIGNSFTVSLLYIITRHTR